MLNLNQDQSQHSARENSLTDQVKALAEKHFERVRQLRRMIHQNPELSFSESSTSKLVAKELQQLGYTVKTGIGGTGVTAELAPLEVKRKAKENAAATAVIGIRADMDALPIQEENSVAYCSNHKGVMHACGHDAHTACGLGAAMILADLHKSGLAGNLPAKVRFLFQPAEECTNDRGKSGATLMMEDGALEGLSALVGLHVFPNIPTGMIGLKEGPLLAACDTFDIKIMGRGCHGAYPQEGIDAIVLAAQAVQAIQTITSRRKSALNPCVITLGGLRSTTYAANIVAEAVELTGTARYFDPQMSTLTRTELERALGVVRALGGDFELKYKHENPPLINDPTMTEAVRQAASKLAGREQILEPGLQLGAEDFSFYCQHTKACFLVLGAMIEGDIRTLHTPNFDINEEALKLGSAILALSTLEFLQNN